MKKIFYAALLLFCSINFGISGCTSKKFVKSNKLEKISFGAYPMRTTFEGNLHSLPIRSLWEFNSSGEKEVINYLGVKGLRHLSDETGLPITGNITYITLNPKAIKEFREGKRKHYLLNSDRLNLQRMYNLCMAPRLSLEPTTQKGREGIEELINNQDVLKDIAKTLKNIPVTMRIASELNLYDNPYHVKAHQQPANNPNAIGPVDQKEMIKLENVFRTVHQIFKSEAPNVQITFSPFIPNGADDATRKRSLTLIKRYLPYVAPYVDMFTGTFYPHKVDEVDGLVMYAQLVKDYGKPFGIDELGCKDEETFNRVMTLIYNEKLGDLRFVNFFDYHVKKPGGIDNPWQLKTADISLLNKLSKDAAQ